MNQHEPNPEFVDHLEWQLSTALRRKQRFARPAGGGVLRVARTAALIAVCLVGGAGIVIGSQQLQLSRETMLLLDKNTVQIDTATLQLEVAAQRFALAESQQEKGFISTREFGAVRLGMRDAEFGLQRLRLEREELEASGRQPNARISAPLIGHRDFVSEGLRLERDRILAHHELEVQNLEHTEKLFASGFTSKTERIRARQPLRTLENELESLKELLVLRAEFTTEQRDAQTTELLVLRIEAHLALKQVEHELEGQVEQFAIIEAQAEAGYVTNAEHLEAKLRLRRLEGKLEMCRLELTLIDERLGH